MTGYSINIFGRKIIQAAEDNEYALGTDEQEIQRLQSQHQVWENAARALWMKAGFCEGQTLLDLGCGPGFATMQLAEIVGSKGRVHAVDVSQRFIAYLQEEIQRNNITTISAFVSDASKIDLESATLDGAYARWVLCFVDDPGKIVKEISRLLRPGGVFAIKDYFNYTATALAPHSSINRKITQAVADFISCKGGDATVGRKLPKLLNEAGFTIQSLDTVCHLARPGEEKWNWMQTFFFQFLPKVIDEGLITQSDYEEFKSEWLVYAQKPEAFYSTPNMIEIVATKN